MFNLDFTTAQESDSSNTSQTGINLKGPKLKSLSRTNSTTSTTTTSMGVPPLDSDINTITAVAQAQGNSGSSKPAKNPPAAQAGKATSLHPINEVISEPADTANDASSVSEDSKTAPVKKVDLKMQGENKKKMDGKGTKSEKNGKGSNGVMTNATRNLSNVSVAKSSSMIGSKANGKKKMEVSEFAFLRFWPQLTVQDQLTIWFWTINNLEEYSKSNMLQEHYLNAYCSRSIFATCSRSSMHFEYGPGTFDIVYSSNLLMVQGQLVLEHMVQSKLVLDHKSKPKSQKSSEFQLQLSLS